jgi:uncharacterized protein
VVGLFDYDNDNDNIRDCCIVYPIVPFRVENMRNRERDMAAMNASLGPLCRRLGAVLAADPGRPICAYLFGSLARGAGRADSDLDIAVLFRTDLPGTLDGLHLDLADALSESAGRPADLVVLNRAPADLIHRVLRDGILLLDLDPAVRIRFEVRARNDYFDLLPYLRRYRRMTPETQP